MLIIFTDCDREGESIGDEIRKIGQAAKRSLIVRRAKFSSLTFCELCRAFENLQNLNEGEINAVNIRQEIDLRTGCCFTRALSMDIRPVLNDSFKGNMIISYGSCQFPTLGFIVEQYLRQVNFQSEEFFKLSLYICLKGRPEEVFLWRRIFLFDRAICCALLYSIADESSIRISDIFVKCTTKMFLIFYFRRPLPLRTVELQKFASSYYKMSSKKSMEIAEKLYNSGLISYPRTETDCFDTNFNHKHIVSALSKHPNYQEYASRYNLVKIIE